MRRIAFFIVAILLLYPKVSRSYGEMKSQVFSSEITVDWKYLLFLPIDYYKRTDTQFPLLLFLHGGGESGSDLEKVKKHGPPKQITGGQTFPFIMLAPQNPHPKQLWDDSAVLALLEDIRENYRVDDTRIYLTGLSRGAYGTWRLAVQYPDTFAAMIAISGEAPSNYATWIGDMAIWVFHGEDDSAIDIEASVRMVQRLREAGNPVKFTWYNNAGHDVWTRTFDNPKVYQWLLKQTK